MCSAPNAGILIPACEACVAEYDNDDTDTDDVSADENGIFTPTPTTVLSARTWY